MGYYAINKSGQKKPVYSTVSSKTQKQIGTLFPNECFALIASSSNSYYKVAFRNSSGSMSTGYVKDSGLGEITNISNYAFGNITVVNQVCQAFKTRANLTCYNSAGQKVGTCPKGARVLTQGTTTPGTTMPYLMKAYFVETGVGTGEFTPIVPNKFGTWGFIDTGIITCGSDSSKIGVYGNW